MAGMLPGRKIADNGRQFCRAKARPKINIVNKTKKLKKYKPKSVNIVTMGCSKNLVDSEKIMAKFSAGGWKINFDSDQSAHEVVIINTCGFINDAKQESIDMLLGYAEEKKNGSIGKLCIIGCLSERYSRELASEFPEADLVLGVDAIDRISGAFDLKNVQCSKDARSLSTPPHYAFLKISEGCNRRCSFCVIPLIRGPYVSRPVGDLTLESAMLAEQGVKELILVAQDLTWYGHDLYGKSMLTELLKKLEAIPGIEWIRLHYAFPVDFPDDLLDLIRDSDKICKYLDIPLQHISDNVLRMMRRGINKKKSIALLKKIRTKVPGIAIRTTFLTGHPGETENDFLEMKEFIKNSKFERLGVFAYSHEENSYAFKNYKDEVPAGEKERRLAEIMRIQQEISASINESRIGKVFRVLIDREDDEFYYGRTEFDSPEVDNEVLVRKAGSFDPGEFCMVRITHSDEFDLYGEIAK
jgi:ribosomal protein S12 methylthiotransferase